MIKGCVVALVTPMQNDGAVDFSALQNLLDWHLASGTKGIVILGTTGESPTIQENEREDIIRFTVKHAQKRYPVIVGTGSYSTGETIKYTRQAKELGADAVLIVTPYYNKPTQEGLFQHYSAVAAAVDIPIIMYNVPGRTACDMKPETVARLAKVKNIIGIKECADLDRVQQLRKSCGENFILVSGNDDSALEFTLLGGDGVISVTANIVPNEMRLMYEAALNGEVEKAKQLNEKLQGLHHNLFVEANPIPVKWSLMRIGKIGEYIRLPLTPLASVHHELLENTLNQAGLL